MDNSGKIRLEVGCGRDDGDWITKLLNEVQKNIDDSDKVMVGVEVISNAEQTFANCVDNQEEDDDDDCVILDGDPDKPVAIENDGGDDSDDLCLIGEKGQVACRDYPHPRHLCVKFPFDSTPHERHCDKCHCYVCDSVAPCVHWGNGVSSNDHCHATEKDGFWKARRKDAKTSYKAPPFVSKVGLTPVNQVLSLPSNPLMHNQEPSASQPCPITSTGTLYGVMPTRTQSGCDPSDQFQPYLYPPHMRRQNVRHSGTHVIPHVPFKRAGLFGGILATIRNLNDSSRNSYGNQFSIQSIGSRRQGGRKRGNSMFTYERTKPKFGEVAQIYSQVRFGSPDADSVAPHPQISSQTCTSSNLGNPMPAVLGVATQQRWGSSLVPVSLELQAASEPNVYQNVAPTQPLVNPHSNMNYASESPINFYRVTPMSLNSQSRPVECTQLQSAIVGGEPATSTDLQWSLISDPHEVDSQFNTWSFTDESVWKDLNVPLSPEYNLFSPESAPVDGSHTSTNRCSTNVAKVG